MSRGSQRLRKRRMKKIIVNGGSITNEKIYGVQRYTLELLEQLDRIVKDYTVELAVPASEANKLQFQNIKIVGLSAPFNKGGSVLWNQLIFPGYVKMQDGIGMDLVLALPARNTPIVAIYDCITERFPENSVNLKEKMRRQYYLWKVKRCLKTADTIITDSQFSRNDICSIYHCREDKIQVIPCAWQHFNQIAEDDSVIDRLKLTDKVYFFSLGSHYFHKNSKWIVSAALQNPEYEFVVAGDYLSVSDVQLKENSSNLSNMHFTGYLSDGEIKSLMRHCRAFIQPSFYEGFGIPPMEAMSVGARCIVSDCTSLPEVYKNSVWYINPNDYSHIDIDEIMRKPIDENSAVLEQYSWSRSAQLLDLILKKAECVNDK